MHYLALKCVLNFLFKFIIALYHKSYAMSSIELYDENYLLLFVLINATAKLDD